MALHRHPIELHSRCRFTEIYRAFLAEIQPQSRVFYLNLERPYYLGLQFLYGQYKRNVPHRESHLIVFLHRNCKLLRSNKLILLMPYND